MTERPGSKRYTPRRTSRSWVTRCDAAPLQRTRPMSSRKRSLSPGGGSRTFPRVTERGSGCTASRRVLANHWRGESRRRLRTTELRTMTGKCSVSSPGRVSTTPPSPPSSAVGARPVPVRPGRPDPAVGGVRMSRSGSRQPRGLPRSGPPVRDRAAGRGCASGDPYIDRSLGSFGAVSEPAKQRTKHIRPRLTIQILEAFLVGRPAIRPRRPARAGCAWGDGRRTFGRRPW
ncbi:MAG: hypothetical protein JWN52_5243 [Actinomycetia bacterium]|nr:hypothetical protein [Actinomycetes bacterium]